MPQKKAVIILVQKKVMCTYSRKRQIDSISSETLDVWNNKDANIFKDYQRLTADCPI